MEKLVSLAKQSYFTVTKTSPMIEEVRYYAKELLRLSERRQAIFDKMVALVNLYQKTRFYALFQVSQKQLQQVLLANSVLFVVFNLLIKLMLSLGLTLDIMSLATV